MIGAKYRINGAGNGVWEVLSIHTGMSVHPWALMKRKNEVVRMSLRMIIEQGVKV